MAGAGEIKRSELRSKKIGRNYPIIISPTRIKGKSEKEFMRSVRFI